MTQDLPAAYCFFQDIKPRPPLDAVFDRDYLLYAIRGALRVTIANDSWLLPPSFAAWVPADTPLLVEIDKPVTTCSVLTSPGFCAALPGKPTVFQMSQMTRLMIEHCKGWGPDDAHPDNAETFFRALLNTCGELSTHSVDTKRPAATDPTLKAALAFTESHLSDRIVAGDVARAVNLSERSLQRRFRDNIGMSWSETLTRLRMIHAVQLLAENDLSIIQIAGAVGFDSLSAFNRAFRKFANRTPTEFRRTLRA